jgi:hypothetical protein
MLLEVCSGVILVHFREMSRIRSENLSKIRKIFWILGFDATDCNIVPRKWNYHYNTTQGFHSDTNGTDTSLVLPQIFACANPYRAVWRITLNI